MELEEAGVLRPSRISRTAKAHRWSLRRDLKQNLQPKYNKRKSAGIGTSRRKDWTLLDVKVWPKASCGSTSEVVFSSTSWNFGPGSQLLKHP